MQLFIDFIDQLGQYRAAEAPSFVADRMPTAVLASAVFLDASGQAGGSRRCRIYHVERGTFVDADRFSELGANDLDTIVIVNCDDSQVDDVQTLDAMWRDAKCLMRGLAHRGMPVTQRRALSAFAS
jgi:hypothetical protein